jgi:hypothetical protein
MCVVLLCGVCCVLHVVCCVLHVACCVLHVACCVLRVVCCMLCVACCVLRVACCVLRVARCALRVARCALCVACCVLRVEISGAYPTSALQIAAKEARCFANKSLWKDAQRWCIYLQIIATNALQLKEDLDYGQR